MNDQPTELTKVAIQSKILHGKRALVIGIANEHSIAYGCARVFRQLGADLAVTYLNEKARPYVEPLAKELGASILAPCDVGRERRARSGLRADPRDLGQPRHRAPLHRLRAEGGPAGTASRQLGRGLQGGDGHLLPFLHPHGAARRAADDARAERSWR